MPISGEHSQELLSVAYVYAVAAQAGLSVKHSFHDYGIDLTLSYVQTLPNGTRMPTGYDLNFQLKATTDSFFRRDCVVYDLKAKNYNYFAGWLGPSPCFLLLMRLPIESEKRLSISEDVLELRDCCYWHYIAPGEIIENTSSKRIEIPRTNKLTPETLANLMDQLRNRTLP